MTRQSRKSGLGRQRVLKEPRPGYDVFKRPPTPTPENGVPAAPAGGRDSEATYRCLRCDFLTDGVFAAHHPRYLECPVCYGYTLHRPHDPSEGT